MGRLKPSLYFPFLPDIFSNPQIINAPHVDEREKQIENREKEVRERENKLQKDIKKLEDEKKNNQGVNNASFQERLFPFSSIRMCWFWWIFILNRKCLT